MVWNVGDDATPIAKLPLEKLRKASQMFDPIYDGHLRPAFERSDCDWELGIEEMRGVETHQLSCWTTSKSAAKSAG